MTTTANAPKVKDILNSEVVALDPTFTTFEAINIFNEHRLSSAPVVNTKKEVVGYLSEIDLIKELGSEIFFDETQTPDIETLMSKNVLSADVNWDVFELEEFFSKNHIHSAPVVDDHNQLVGIVTQRDVLKSLQKQLKEMTNHKAELKKPIELNLRDKIIMAITNHH